MAELRCDIASVDKEPADPIEKVLFSKNSTVLGFLYIDMSNRIIFMVG